MDNLNISLKKVVGKKYNRFWHFKGRYRVIKGSRASKKSKTAALWFITNMMNYPGANTLVIRKTFRTLKDSCFTELKWAISRLKVQEHWKITESPLQMTYIPTGQTIYFRGLDDPLKVTSITVDVGSLCWMWIEEAYEIMKEPDFDILDESIRGQVEDGLFKQITLTFNPWNEHHWIKKRFFDAAPDPDILALTTNYMCNEWLDAADKKVFETMRVNNPRRYRVAGLGDWGIVEGLVYENWKEQNFILMTKAEYEKREIKPDDVVFSDTLNNGFGLDFGYTNDPSAAFIGFVDLDNKKIYVYDEMYEKGLSNKRIYQNIVDMGYIKDRFTGDCAEPKSIDELKGLGMRIKGALKGKDSVNAGIQWIQDFEIIIHPRCVNFLTEISNYTWNKDKFGNKMNVPVDDFNHLMDAMRYGLEGFIKGNKWMY
jgi:phage terminase large subunit